MNSKRRISTIDSEPQLAVLNTLISATHTWTDTQAVLFTALEQVAGLAGAEAGECHLVNARGELEFTAHYNLDPDFAAASREFRFSPGEGIPGWAYSRQEAVYVPEIEAEERYLRRSLAARAGYRSLVCIPLSGMDALLGTLILYYRREMKPIRDAQQVLTVVGKQMGIAVERARLFQQTEKQVKELQVLQAVSNALNRSANIQEALERSLEAVVTAMGLPSGWVVLMDGIQGIRIAASYNLPPELSPEDWAAMQTPCHCLDLQQHGLLKSAANIVECQQLSKIARPHYPFRHHASIPLRAGSVRLGNLNLVTPGDRAFTEDELRMFNAIGDQIGVAVERALLYEESRERRIQEQLILLGHSRALLGKRETQSILDHTIAVAASALQADHAVLALVDPGGGTYSARAGIGQPAAMLQNLQAMPIEEETPICKVIRTKTPVIASDMTRETLCGEGEGCENKPAAMLVVPMLAGSQTLGAVAVHADTPRAWSEDDIRLLSLLANQAAAAVENARLFENLANEQNNMTRLYHLGIELAASLDPQKIAHRALQAAAEAVGVQRGNILTLEGGGESMRLLAVTGYDRETVDEINQRLNWNIHRGVTGRVVRACAAAIVPEVARDADWVAIPGLDDWVRSMLSVPLVAGNTVVGALNLLSEQLDFFKAENLSLVAAIASPVALSLQNARLYENLRQRLGELEIISDTSSALRKAQSNEAIQDILLAKAVEGLNANAGVLLLLENGKLRIAAVYGESRVSVGETHSSRAGMMRQALKNGELLFVPDVTQHKEFHTCRLCQALMEEARSCVCVPLQTSASTIGLVHLNWKTKAALTADESRLLESIAEIAANAIHRSALHEQTVQQALDLTQAYDATIEGWSRALDLRDHETEGHTRRVTDLALELARAVRIPEPDLLHFRRGALLHDIGKMGIPDDILRKAGTLSDEEWAIMRQHPQFACDMLSSIAYLQPALDIPWCHHEKWDGSGYPRGLKGEQIPLAARIFTVADVFDALTSDRAYRSAWTREEAIALIRRQAGIHFDPRIVGAFLKMTEQQQ